ncbi:hypothetical protein VNO80_11650 [Phaseolus coccineus]|uniref:Uncharacterized protein n=1 Tax=Phaseolus coccineus TaxID=3886 RepID=A0AAN9NGX3_PHACN
MVESIAATLPLGHRPICHGNLARDVFVNPKSLNSCRLPATDFLGGGRIVVSLALPKSYKQDREEKLPSKDNNRIDSGFDQRPVSWPPANRADNPLLWHERMGCGWFGAIFEWEGVLVEDNSDLDMQAWPALSQEEGKSSPPVFILKRIVGM